MAMVKLSKDDWQKLLNLVQEYHGDFKLNSACIPVLWKKVLQEGYKVRISQNKRTHYKIHYISIVVSAEKVFDLFYDLLDLFSRTVNVVLESSHFCARCSTVCSRRGHKDFLAEDVDLVVLKSLLCENKFQELLVNDGDAGIAVFDTRGLEVQFDEHKFVEVYEWKSAEKKLRAVLRQYGLKRKSDLTVISDFSGTSHLHSSSPSYEEQFEELKRKLGIIAE